MPFLQFLGWPRSGTTLVKSLLNGHPGVSLAHEADVSALVVAGRPREEILARMRESQERFEAGGSHWSGYDYRFSDPRAAPVATGPSPRAPATVMLGDKKAGGTAEVFALHPDVFQRTESVLECSLRLLVVIRNPFDVIATISKNLPGDIPDWFRVGRDPLVSAIDWYALLATVVQRAVDAQPCPIHLLSFADLIADPADTVETALRFLGVLKGEEVLDPSYVKSIRSKVFTTARRPALEIGWTPEQTQRVLDLIQSVPILDSTLADPS